MDGIRRRIELNRRELSLGLTDTASWHSQYSHSAYVYIGGLPRDLTEGDLLAILSQYGELVDLDLVRDRDSGSSKGFAFAAYEDQRSTILAVDNLNGVSLLGRLLSVDHVSNYKRGKASKDGTPDTQEEEEAERRKHILPRHLLVFAFLYLFIQTLLYTLAMHAQNPQDLEEDAHHDPSSKSDSEEDSAKALDPMRDYLQRPSPKKSKKKSKKDKKSKKKDKKKAKRRSDDDEDTDTRRASKKLKE